MTSGSQELDRLPRDELIARARRLGVERAEVMTRVELRDEIVRRSIADEAGRRRARGWLGVARDLVASLIESGLNMPDAAKLVRSGVVPTKLRHQPPVATVTLAEIYATQGHVSRAVAMLDEVLAKEPDHGAARVLRDRLRQESGRAVALPEPEPELEPEPEESELELELTQPTPAETPEAPPPTPEAPEVPEPEPPQLPQPEPKSTRDAIATIVTDAGSVWIYWEIAESSLARARQRWPEGRAVVQIVALVPRWEGARRFERTISAEPACGSTLTPPFGDRAVARAALGWQAPDRFHPFAVGSELGPPNGAADGARVRFAPSARAAADVAFQERALSRFVRAAAI